MRSCEILIHISELLGAISRRELIYEITAVSTWNLTIKKLLFKAIRPNRVSEQSRIYKKIIQKQQMYLIQTSIYTYLVKVSYTWVVQLKTELFK